MRFLSPSQKLFKGLLRPFQVVKSALTDWWDAWLSLAVINVLWLLCCLTIILGPPATLTLYAVVNQLVHGQAVRLGDFIVGLRQNFLRGWLWALLNIIIVFLGWNGLRFYQQLGDVGNVLQTIILAILMAWLIVQFYALPYWMEQQDRRLLVALRNGLFTMLASPFYTLILIVFCVLVIGISVVSIALMFLGGVCFVALLGTRAVLERLETFGLRQRNAEPIFTSSES